MAGIWRNWLIGGGNTTLLLILSIPIPHSQEDATLSKLYIWQNRGFFMGRLPDISEHRLGSAALCVGIDQPFRVLESESSGWRECRIALVPPGCLHEIQVGVYSPEMPAVIDKIRLQGLRRDEENPTRRIAELFLFRGSRRAMPPVHGYFHIFTQGFEP